MFIPTIFYNFLQVYIHTYYFILNYYILQNLKVYVHTYYLYNYKFKYNLHFTKFISLCLYLLYFHCVIQVLCYFHNS